MVWTLVLVVFVFGHNGAIGNRHVSVSTEKIEGFSSFELCDKAGKELVQKFSDNLMVSKYSCIQVTNPAKDTETAGTTTSPSIKTKPDKSQR